MKFFHKGSRTRLLCGENLIGTVRGEVGERTFQPGPGGIIVTFLVGVDKLGQDQSKSYVRILVATFLPHFSVSLALSAIGPLAPFLQEAFQISRAQIGILTSAQSVGSIAMATISGGIVERFGIRSWIFLSQAITGMCAFCFANTASFTLGMALFLITGFAFSFVNPATTKAIIIFFPHVRRGTAIAIKQCGVPAGALLASASLPAIAVSAGWEKSMLAVALITVLGAVGGWLFYPDNDGELLAGRNRSFPQHSFRKDFGKLLRNKDFLLTSGLQGIFNMGQFVIRSYLVLYLVEAIGCSILFAGFTMAVMQLSGLVSRLLWGMISDFLFAGRRIPVLQIIGSVTFAGLIGLAFLDKTMPAWFIWVIACTAGAGSEGFPGTAILLRAELAGKDLAATSTGLGMAISFWGVLLGPPLFGFVVDMTNSYRFAWMILAVITFVATVLLRFIHEPTSRTIEKGPVTKGA